MNNVKDRNERDTKLAALREEIRKGAESGAGVLASDVFERLEAKYRGSGGSNGGRKNLSTAPRSS